MNKSLLPGLIVLMIIGGCASEKPSPMEGVWQLAFEYDISGNHTTTIYPGTSEGSEMKIWSGNQFTFFGMFVEDSIYTPVYGGGTFTLKGNSYTEFVQYHSAPEYQDQTVTLSLEIKNDTLIQIWPVDVNGQGLESGYFMEKWVKVD